MTSTNHPTGLRGFGTAARPGQHKAKAVYKILQHAQIDPNKACETTKTKPLCTAACHGHVKVVTALLGHPEIRVNLGKLDANASPLFEAAQEGREEVMFELLGASRVDINQATTVQRGFLRSMWRVSWGMNTWCAVF
jgi:hypothetical protein